MQNLTSTLSRLAVVLTGALTLGACSRAEYAFLPKSASYLGTTTAAPKARVATEPVATTAPVAQAPVVVAPIAEAPEIVIATAPAAPHVAKVATPTPPVQAEAAITSKAATVATQAPQKLSLVQRIALAKVTKKLNKLADKAPQFKQGDNTAHTSRISGNLRTGIILILIGLLISLLSGISGIFGLIGGIIAIIGLIFIILWLLDSL
jgi:hypothetical protein